jgi:hypothetical protein
VTLRPRRQRHHDQFPGRDRQAVSALTVSTAPICTSPPGGAGSIRAIEGSSESGTATSPISGDVSRARAGEFQRARIH